MSLHLAHDPEPDYERPRLVVPDVVRERILRRLQLLYGEAAAAAAMPELERMLAVYYAHKPPELIAAERSLDPTERFSERDVILITYGDLIHGGRQSPLATLGRFCDEYLEGTINTLHILPFFPYSSDRGFSVVDFETVDPKLGTWDDIEALGRRYRLMFDGVVNHVSARSRWFRSFQDGHPYYSRFFTAFVSAAELTPEQRQLIFRPRTSDILTRFATIHGPRYVWTTFSADQVDLNYKNPDVLLRVLEVLLLYVRRSADIIRLDAITYLWEEPGTSCVHLAQTHEIVKLFRDVLDLVAPGVALITETNVPHADNISYFGNGQDEAQLVYNFALPPLVLHAFYTEDTSILSAWAAKLENVSDATSFFNFLDSHDGIGLMGVQGILPPEEVQRVIARAQEHGALVSYKTGDGGVETPYEINTTWFSALNREDAGEDVAFQVRRFVASRVIGLVLQGVPAIYLHSLIGTQNDIDAVLASDSKRDINRSIIDAEAITNALHDPLSKLSRISREFGRLILLRTRRNAFHPNGAQRVLMLSPRVFAVLRVSPDGMQRILTITNVSAESCHVEVSLGELETPETHWYDVVGAMEWMADQGVLYITVEPYGTVWLEPYRDDHARDEATRAS
jgi:sucrose phosphorylase